MFSLIAINVIINYVLEWFHVTHLRRKMPVELVSKKNQSHSKVMIGDGLNLVTRFQLFSRKWEIDITEVEIKIRVLQKARIFRPGCVL
jgi:hypothetical protein